MAKRYTRTYTDWSEVPLMFGMEVACRITTLSDQTLRKYIKLGELPAKNGRPILFEKTSFMDWVNARRCRNDLQRQASE